MVRDFLARSLLILSSYKQRLPLLAPRKETVFFSSYYMMSKAAVLPLLLLFLCLSGGQTAAVDDNKRKDFDYWTLSFVWGPTACRQTTECCSSNSCCRVSAPAMFVIDGFWPECETRTSPTSCKCDTLDLRKISSLLPLLEVYWPFLSCKYSKLCHDDKTRLQWAYEWERYGTCGSPNIKDEYEYFLVALSLYSRYDLTKFLSNSGFVASNHQKYPSSDIVSILNTATGVSTYVHCRNGYIESVQLCFNKNYELRNCSQSSHCPKSVMLPAYGPLGDKADITQVIPPMQLKSM